MDLLSPTTIKELLLAHDAKPKKTMGQNFLIDKKTLSKIMGAADIQPTDTVIEVGPGIGTLTQALAQKAAKVIAIEKDKKMLEILHETLADYKNVEVIHADVLKYPISIPQYKLIANLPYYITSPAIRKFLETPYPPQRMVLMVQKEVAQRICAVPPHTNLLAVSVQFYAQPRIISYVSKNCFWPAPSVDSAILEISPMEHRSPEVDGEKFFSVVKAGFSHPRKQLVNNLATFKSPDGVTLEKYAASQWLARCGVNSNRRAETLTISEWISLASLL